MEWEWKGGKGDSWLVGVDAGNASRSAPNLGNRLGGERVPMWLCLPVRLAI